ncbi:hypothetical protein [Actinophytocola sediminis]
MTRDVVSLLIAGLVALAFLLLIGFLVWRLTAMTPDRVSRTLVAVGALIASLPAVLYVLLDVSA